MPYNDYKDNDYTKYRAFGSAPVTSDVSLKIGRQDPTYIIAVDITPTVSGTTLRSNR